MRLPLGQTLRSGITRSVAEALVPEQVASLRYDKRGVGASGGDFYAAGMDQRLADAAAALGWLADRHPGLPLLVIGHSEGTYHAARLAADDSRVAGAVLLAGSARPGGEVLAWQTAQLADRLPRSAKVILRLLRTDAVRAQRKNQDKIMASTTDFIRLNGARVPARWVRDFVRYDPAPALSGVGVSGARHHRRSRPAGTAGRRRSDRQARTRPVRRARGRRPEPHAPARPRCSRPRGYRRAGREPMSPDVLILITGWVARHWDGAGR